MLDILTYHAAYRRATAEEAARTARLRRPNKIKTDTAAPVARITRTSRTAPCADSPRPLAA